MFGRAFSIFNPGSRGGSVSFGAPSPILVLGGSGLLVKKITYTDAQMKALGAGVAQTLVAGVPGAIICPVSISVSANITANGGVAVSIQSMRYETGTTPTIAIGAPLAVVVAANGIRKLQSNVGNSAVSVLDANNVIGASVTWVSSASAGAGYTTTTGTTFNFAYYLARIP